LRKSPLLDTSALAPCNHEEADTHIMLHAAHAAHSGHKKILICTVDTDVVVLAVTLARTLNEETQVWVSFGMGNNFRFLATHEIARALGPEKAQALPMFHAWTGCDTVSCFAGHGKRTAWAVWTPLPELTQTLTLLSDISPLHRIVLMKTPCIPLKGSSHCFTTEQAPKPISTRHVANCLLRKATSS